MPGLVVTVGTPLREQLRIIHLGDMNIVAGGAIHLAHPETFTGSKQSILIRMYVQGGKTSRIIRGSGIIVQGIAHGKGEGGPERRSQAGMAECAGIQPLLPAQEPGIYNIAASLFIRVGLVESYMSRSGSMTFFAVYSIDDAAFIEYSAQVVLFFRSDIGAMAFHALRVDLLVKIQEIGREAGAIAPAVRRAIPGDRQLEQPDTIPVQVRLSFSAGADHDIEGLPLHKSPVEPGGLEKPVFLFFHDHFHVRVVGKAIFFPVKTSLDEFFCGGAGIQVMGCLTMRVIDILVAGRAGGGTNEGVVILVGPGAGIFDGPGSRPDPSGISPIDHQNQRQDNIILFFSQHGWIPR